MDGYEFECWRCHATGRTRYIDCPACGAPLVLSEEDRATYKLLEGVKE